MFLKQLAEDYDFEDIKFVFENDKYFIYSTQNYKLTEEDAANIEILKTSTVEPKKYSLDVVTVRKNGLLSRAEIIDQEDEFKNLRIVPIEELAAYPVDMVYSGNQRRGVHLLISVLLEQTFYKLLEKDGSSKKRR